MAPLPLAAARSSLCGPQRQRRQPCPSGRRRLPATRAAGAAAARAKGERAAAALQRGSAWQAPSCSSVAARRGSAAAARAAALAAVARWKSLARGARRAPLRCQAAAATSKAACRSPWPSPARAGFCRERARRRPSLPAEPLSSKPREPCGERAASKDCEPREAELRLTASSRLAPARSSSRPRLSRSPPARALELWQWEGLVARLLRALARALPRGAAGGGAGQRPPAPP